MIESLMSLGDGQLLGSFLIGFVLLCGAKAMTAIYGG
jgi:hypothetical protein